MDVGGEHDKMMQMTCRLIGDESPSQFCQKTGVWKVAFWVSETAFWHSETAF